MIKIKVICGGREIEVELPSRQTSDEHKNAIALIKEVCEQIIKMNP